MAMKPTGEVYTKSFFAHRGDHSWRAPFFCDAISAAEVRFGSVIDLGCGDGDLIAEFRKRKKIAYGVEGSEHYQICAKIDPSYVYVWDLRLPFAEDLGICTSGINFDLVLSLEVAEHIEPEYADVYVDRLIQENL